MRSSPRRAAGAAVAVLGLILSVLAIMAPAASAAGPGQNPDFKGTCTETQPGSGTCVIDEPMGNNPATHGTVTYTRTGDSITFQVDVNPGEGPITEIQVCMVVDSGQANPYVPTAANSCAGSNTSGTQRVYSVSGNDVENPFTLDLAALGLTGFDAGDAVLFALHINIPGRTTYVVGRSTPPNGGVVPTYECSAATNVTPTSATLNGSTTDESVTSAVFTLDGVEYLASASPFSVEVEGLSPDTAYSYSVAFKNVDGVVVGNAQSCSFRTLVSDTPPPVVTNPALSASAKCAAGGRLVTVTNTGDGPGSADVSNNGTFIGKVTVPAGQARTVLVPIEEDDEYAITVSGVTGTIAGTQDCIEVDGIVIPRPDPVITPVVKPAVVTPAVVTPTEKPATQVLGNVITRPKTLARTGSDTLPLLEVGLGLLILGAGLTLSSRKDQAKA